MKIELSEEEASQLANLLDLAVKTSGIQAARVALPILQKIETALAERNKRSQRSR